MILISHHLRRFVCETGISLLEFKELTGLSSSQVMRWYAGDDSLLKEKNILNLEKGLCTSVEKMQNQVGLAKRFFENYRGEKIVVAEKYVDNARSFVRSSSHIVKYLELLFGRERIGCILKEMGVHRAYLDELDNKISIVFFVDLLEKCKQLGFSKADLRSLAGALFLSLEGTESEKLFKPCANFKEAYENVSQVVNLFDTNFYYDFKVTDSSVKIVSEPHEAIERVLEKIPVEYLFYYRKQVFGTVPRMCGLDDIYLDLDHNLKPNSFTQIFYGVFPDSSYSRQLKLV